MKWFSVPSPPQIHASEKFVQSVGHSLIKIEWLISIPLNRMEMSSAIFNAFAFSRVGFANYCNMFFGIGQSLLVKNYRFYSN